MREVEKEKHTHTKRKMNYQTGGRWVVQSNSVSKEDQRLQIAVDRESLIVRRQRLTEPVRGIKGLRMVMLEQDSRGT